MQCTEIGATGVLVFSGAGYTKAVSLSTDLSYRQSLMVVMLGICDITRGGDFWVSYATLMGLDPEAYDTQALSPPCYFRHMS